MTANRKTCQTYFRRETKAKEGIREIENQRRRRNFTSKLCRFGREGEHNRSRSRQRRQNRRSFNRERRRREKRRSRNGARFGSKKFASSSLVSILGNERTFLIFSSFLFGGNQSSKAAVKERERETSSEEVCEREIGSRSLII